MQEGFAAERSRRQAAKMEEGFQQAQKEIMGGLKNEENARRIVQTDLQAIRQLVSGSGSGSTVGSDVSTANWKKTKWHFCRLAQRFTHAEEGGIQTMGQTTNTVVTNFIQNMHRMAPDPQKRYVDWEQTQTEQETWPTKIMVNVWFSNEAKLPTRIGLLDIIRSELKKKPF